MRIKNTQQTFASQVAGRRRWCDKCHQMVSTQLGKYVPHGRTDAATFQCPNSGQPVPRAS
jgi:hypothetical protein